MRPRLDNPAPIRWWAWLLLAGIVLAGGRAHAGQPPAYPMADVDLNAHIDRTTGIDFDPKRNWLVTASDDRSIRVWDAANGRLVRTIWVPRDERKDGELYALSIDPGTTTAAVGGWTGYDWDGSMSIYVVNLETGKFIGRIRGFEERITSLAYSRDGSKLAVMLLNGHLLVLSVPGYKVESDSKLCKTTSYRVDFGPQNHLVANCFDGYVRLYDENLHLLAKREILPGKRPGAVRFSPDGKLIAVGFFDSNQVQVVDASTLETAYAPDTSAAKGMPLFAVEWSQDGSTLYAAGDLKRNGHYRIIRWDKGGKGPPVEFDASTKRMLRLRALPNGALAYTSMEHGVVVVEADDKARFDDRPSLYDYQWQQTRLLVSENGKTVAFGVDHEGKRFGVFSLERRSLAIVSHPDPALRPPLVKYPGLDVTDWHKSYHPKFNGRPIKLAGEQQSHSLAIDRKGRFFVLGLDSELRAYNPDGSVRWSVYPSSGPYTVNLSGDGTLVVAGCQDGTIRWYRAKDGKRILSLFPHGDGKDWVAWTPTGHFMSSPNGDRYIGWQLNNGPDKAADFYSAWQFERVLYRPDLVQQYFALRGDIPKGKPWAGAFNVAELRDSAPPDVSLSVTGEDNKDEATIEVSAQKHKSPIKEYTVYVNSIPVTPYKQRLMSGEDRDKFQRKDKIPLFGKENQIRVEVFTDRSFQVAQTYVDVAKAPPRNAHRGDLYVLAVGVNHLSHLPGSDLSYAAQDADAMVSHLEHDTGKLFDHVHAKVLSDTSGELPTKGNIVKSLTFLRQAGADDTVMLFLASHGISNDAGDYFMVPRDATVGDVALLLEGRGADTVRHVDSLIRWDTFFDALRAASGRRLLLVDTCQAKKIEGNFDVGSLAKHSAAASFALLAASKGDESSQEYPPGKHGLFTYALLHAMGGSADDNKDGYVELNELFAHARAFVEKNRMDKNLAQTPQLVAPVSLDHVRLAVDR